MSIRKIFVGSKIFVPEYPETIFEIIHVFKNGNCNIESEGTKQKFRLTKADLRKFNRYMDEDFCKEVEKILLHFNCCMGPSQIGFYLKKKGIFFQSDWFTNLPMSSKNIVFEKNGGYRHINCTRKISFNKAREINRRNYLRYQRYLNGDE